MQKQSVVNNTQRKAVVPVKPRRNIQQKAATLQPDSSKPTTFGERKQNFKEQYNWNVVFPTTSIHENSILYRETALRNSLHNKWKVMSEKMVTMGSSNLCNDFGGSTKELSPRKLNNAKLLLEQKHAKSEISLNQLKNEETKAQTSVLLNMIGLPFNWKSRMLTSRTNNSNSSNSEKNKKRPNLLTNFWKKKRIGDALTCNKR